MVRLITLVCLAVAFWEGCNALEQIVPYGTSNSSSSGGGRIIGGVPVNIHQYSYQVALTSSGIFCGGSIISDYWVLTAAHCAQGVIGGMLLRAGTTYYNSQGTTRTVSQKIVHPSYNTPQYLDNDVALLKVSSPWIFACGISKIALPLANAAVATGLFPAATGWGLTLNGGTSLALFLNMVNLGTISNADCAAVYGAVITPSKLCAYTVNKGVCSGDSGGPLVYNNVLIGVTSFAASNACGLYPSGFARVAYFISWISTSTGGNPG